MRRWIATYIRWTIIRLIISTHEYTINDMNIHALTVSTRYRSRINHPHHHVYSILTSTSTSTPTWVHTLLTQHEWRELLICSISYVVYSSLPFSYEYAKRKSSSSLLFESILNIESLILYRNPFIGQWVASQIGSSPEVRGLCEEACGSLRLGMAMIFDYLYIYLDSIDGEIKILVSGGNLRILQSIEIFT